MLCCGWFIYLFTELGWVQIEFEVFLFDEIPWFIGQLVISSRLIYLWVSIRNHQYSFRIDNSSHQVSWIERFFDHELLQITVVNGCKWLINTPACEIKWNRGFMMTYIGALSLLNLCFWYALKLVYYMSLWCWCYVSVSLVGSSNDSTICASVFQWVWLFWMEIDFIWR